MPSQPAVRCPRATATPGSPGASSPQDPGCRGQDGRHRPGAEEGGSSKFTTHTQFAGLQSTYHSPATPTSTALGENPEFPRRSDQTLACAVCSPAPGTHNAQRAPSTSSRNTNARAPLCATHVPVLISKASETTRMPRHSAVSAAEAGQRDAAGPQASGTQRDALLPRTTSSPQPRRAHDRSRTPARFRAPPHPEASPRPSKAARPGLAGS